MKTSQIRLHKFLINWLKENSKASYTIPEIKRNITSHGVFVSGILTHSQLEWVYPNQEIKLNDWPTREPGDLSKIKVIFEDEDCLVINKPMGVVVEPGAGHPLDNIVQWLVDTYPEQDFKKLYEHETESFEELTQKYYDDSDEESRFNKRAWAKMTGYRPDKKASNEHLVMGKMLKSHQYNIAMRQEKIQSRKIVFGGGSGINLAEDQAFRNVIPRSGLVHRLDKDTQGLLLVGKNLESFNFLQDQFRSRSVVKKYLAVVDGIVDQEIRIENWQARSLSNPIEQKFFWIESDAFGYSKEARHAESVITPLFTSPETNQTIIQIQIKTGRMHQIRIQCLALGFPLSNDKAYNNLNKLVENPNNSKAEGADYPQEGEGTARLQYGVLSEGWHTKSDEVFKADSTQNGIKDNIMQNSDTQATLITTKTNKNPKPIKLPKDFLSNPHNSAVILTKAIPELNAKEFQLKQKSLFGEGQYCLLSNQLEIILPSGKPAKFVVNKID
jgi:23S rRNA-/tRNA-specific pseudouridylate synthase